MGDSWYPNASDLAKQDFDAIAAASAQVPSTELQKWADSGVQFNELVTISAMIDSSPGALAISYAEHDCKMCKRCTDSCMALFWCFPCWGMYVSFFSFLWISLWGETI